MTCCGCIAAGWAALRERSFEDDPQRRLAAFLVISVIPAAILGALGESFFDEYFRERLLLVPLLMAVGALILAAAEWYGRRQRPLDGLTIGDSVSIGVAQTLALFPGISRSGITIATGLFRGLERESAARFAFLMGIPVIAGATIWKMRALVAAPPSSADFAALIVGMVVSAVVGTLAIGLAAALPAHQHHGHLHPLPARLRCRRGRAAAGPLSPHGGHEAAPPAGHP